MVLIAGVLVLALIGAVSGQGSRDTLVLAAKQEGQLTVIALSRDWCRYGELIDGFKEKYGLRVTELNPDGGAGDAIEALKANRDNKGSQAPDVIAVGLSFGQLAKKEGLLQPYKVAAWSTIPNHLKDPEGYWYGAYYGVMVFEINADIIKTSPRDWPDLLKPEYKNAIALAGDARVANVAIQSVLAAGLSLTGDNADRAADAGLTFFAELNKVGNFVPVIGRTASLAQGITPIMLRWDFNALTDRDVLQGNPRVDVVVPRSGVLGGLSTHAISAYAPHPNAAKLWQEYVYSDEGQMVWLKGYCQPVRLQDLVKSRKIPVDLLERLPPAVAYAKPVFPTLDQQNHARAIITRGWDTVVGATVR
jgi:putative spermidine/putrescine transport system substrate-binding protein